jgi:nucleotide-binding universal stress UspA family protein
MFDRILVPLDGSENAEFVLPYVTEFTVKFGSRIVLTHVSDTEISVNVCRAYLEEVAKGMVSKTKNALLKNKCEIVTRVLLGNPASELLYCADEMECDLIAILNRGETNVNTWPLGNVAGKILRASTIPVMLIRKPSDGQVSYEGNLIKKILLPLDGSRLGEAAIPAASEISNKMNAEVVLFQVVEPYGIIKTPGVVVANGTDVVYGSSVSENPGKLRAMEYLNSVRNTMMAVGVKVTIATGLGSSAEQIIDYAEANSIDLITMSTHGKSGVGRWVFGSVADKVLHAGITPILVIRPEKM